MELSAPERDLQAKNGIPVDAGFMHLRGKLPVCVKPSNYLQRQPRSPIDPAIVCDAPVGRLEGADAYRAFMTPFTQILVSSRIIAAFGDEHTALVMYDTETVPVKRAPGAECVTVVNGKIIRSWFLFDRAPFDAARNAAS